MSLIPRRAHSMLQSQVCVSQRCLSTLPSSAIRYRDHHARPARSPTSRTAYSQQKRAFWGSSSSAGVSAASLNPFSGSGAGQAAWESLEFLPQIAPDLLPVFLALLLAFREDAEETGPSPETIPASSRPYNVQSMPSKGLGAIARRSLVRGEVIITERPLVIWPAGLSAEQARVFVDQLTPSARKAYLSLANAADPSMNMDPVLAIRATNGFNVELPAVPANLIPANMKSKEALPKTASFIFPKIARINHSCLPNADHSIDWASLKMTVYATTDIQPGEEINIEYAASLVQKTREERRSILQRDFGFVCHCRVCGGQDKAVRESDGRRREINAIVEALGRGDMKRQDMWGALERMQTLLEQEGYKAMPEFNNPRISDAYVGFINIKQRRQSEAS